MKRTLKPATVSAVVGLGLAAAILPAGPASAGGHVRCNDVAALKKAINRANTNGGDIRLAPDCTYTLTAPDNTDDGLPEISGTVRISGHNTTIRRARNATQNFRIFHVVSGGKLTLRSLTVRGGRLLGDDGGGIANEQGALSLNSVRITGNHASMGGGLYNTGGKLDLRRTTADHNTTDLWGAGIYNTDSGTLKMRGGSLRDNQAANNGGGLENIAATAWLRSVSVTSNSAEQGGGIRQTQSASMHLESSVVSNNTATDTGGGISNNLSAADLVRSRVTHNVAQNNGGGIINENSGTVALERSTVTDNTPNNCAPAGSIASCTDPAAPPTSPTPPAGDTAV